MTTRKLTPIFDCRFCADGRGSIGLDVDAAIDCATAVREGAIQLNLARDDQSFVVEPNGSPLRPCRHLVAAYVDLAVQGPTPDSCVGIHTCHRHSRLNERGFREQTASWLWMLLSGGPHDEKPQLPFFTTVPCQLDHPNLDHHVDRGRAGEFHVSTAAMALTARDPERFLAEFRRLRPFGEN